MYKYACLNSIDKEGLETFNEKFQLTNDFDEADGIIVRSASMHDMTISNNLKCIIRSGIGVNNIPIDKCSQAGVVVFNTPGANANAVKEMVLTAMLISSRDIIGGVECVKENRDNNDIAQLMEKEKKRFKGNEIYGKKLGIIGLGSIGVLVANAALSLGMKVYGYDPYLSVNSALNLDARAKRVKDINEIYTNCDFITIHVPLVESTKNTVDKESIEKMKDNVVIINFSRDILCDEDAIIQGLDSGKIKKYFSDFANNKTAGHPKCIITPHLGASTYEAEKNSAVMAVEEMQDFLINGNISHSINFSNCNMGICEAQRRITIIHKNITNMIAEFSRVLGESDINIDKMINSSKGDLAYTIIDINSDCDRNIVSSLEKVNSVIRVRVI